MNKTITKLLIILTFSFFFSCSETNETSSRKDIDTTTVSNEKPPIEKENLIKHINELESKITDTTELNRGLAMDLILSYAKFANFFPKDSLSPDFLYKAADISRNIGEGKIAVNYYKRILNDYPEFDKNAITMFMLAFTYENILNDTSNARKYYKLFIKKYPNHEFADDAKNLLNLLGKDPTTIVQEFEKN